VPDKSHSSAYSEQADRQGIFLLLMPITSIVAIVPAWSVLCGALTAHSGRRPFEGGFDPYAGIALALVVFVVQVLWGTIRALLINKDRDPFAVDLPDAPALLPKRHRIPRLPYVTPGSPLARLGQKWRRAFQRPEDRLTLALVPLLTLLLSSVIGWQAIVLSVAAMSISLIESRLTRQDKTSSALQSATLVGLGWLAGHTAFAPLTWITVTLSCCYAIAYQGALELERDNASPARHSRLPWALGLLYGGQTAALVLLITLARPLAAASAGFLLAPQWLLLALLETGSCRSYVRHAVPFVTAAMLSAAWAVSA
jgi:hypothetical protein